MKAAAAILLLATSGVPRQALIPSAPAEPTRKKVTLVLQYTRQRITSCNGPKANFHRQKPACRPERRADPGTAKLELVPMPDPRRELFGPDKRQRVDLELRYENRTAVRLVGIEQGPWQLNWRGANKSLQFDVETGGKSVVLSSVLGACRPHWWYCKLDALATLHRIELKDATATSPGR